MSKNKETKYSFKGSAGKKVDNKFSNIYQDLVEKEDKTVENLLLKIHTAKQEEEPTEDRNIIKEVDSKTAEINSRKRRQAALNQLKKATSKSQPIYELEKESNSNIEDDLKRLKEEKDAEKIATEGIEDTKKFEALGIRSIDDEIDYIRQKARERKDMDKSSVEIYKEYSEFEKNDMKSHTDDNEDTKKIPSLDDIPTINKNILEEITHRINKSKEVDFDFRDRRDEDRVNLQENNLNHDENLGFDNTKPDDEIESMENDIRQIKKIQSRGERKGSKKSFLNDGRSQVKNTRESVYKKSLSEKKSNSKRNKKIAIAVILIFVGLIFSSALYDKLKSSKNNDSKTKVEVNKEVVKSKPVSKTQKKEDYIKKLKSLATNLNDAEKNRLQYIIDNINSYPDEMIEKLIRNQEALDYVYSYKDKDKYNKKSLENITSSYYVDGSVPLFLQWDRRWGYRNYGKEMIGLSGCGPTSLAMVIKHFYKNQDINPYEVAKYSQENGYVSPNNFTSWKLFEEGLKKFGLESKDIVPVEAKMKRALDDGAILIASVKPGIFTDRGHIIVIKGYNKNGDFLINDPNSILNTTKAWSFDELKDQIRKIWAINKINGFKDSSKNNTDTQEKNDGSDDPSIIQDIDG